MCSLGTFETAGPGLNNSRAKAEGHKHIKHENQNFGKQTACPDLWPQQDRSVGKQLQPVHSKDSASGPGSVWVLSLGLARGLGTGGPGETATEGTPGAYVQHWMPEGAELRRLNLCFKLERSHIGQRNRLSPQNTEK